MWRFRYSALGLQFDRQDWRIILNVEPGSVAAGYGIKPGDMLLKVNGLSAYAVVYHGNYPTSNKNPYFRNIISNRGDRDVELVIRKADTEANVTLIVRPRPEDRYMYSNPGANGGFTPIKSPTESPK